MLMRVPGNEQTFPVISASKSDVSLINYN